MICLLLPLAKNTPAKPPNICDWHIEKQTASHPILWHRKKKLVKVERKKIVKETNIHTEISHYDEFERETLMVELKLNKEF